MSGPVDFVSVGLRRLEEADRAACLAAAPTSFTSLEDGEEAVEVRAHCRPLSPIERQAFDLPRSGIRALAVVTYAEYARGAWWAGRCLVRLPSSHRVPRTSGQACWTMSCVVDSDVIELTPRAMERLRVNKPAFACEVTA